MVCKGNSVTPWSMRQTMDTWLWGSPFGFFPASSSCFCGFSPTLVGPGHGHGWGRMFVLVADLGGAGRVTVYSVSLPHPGTRLEQLWGSITGCGAEPIAHGLGRYFPRCPQPLPRGQVLAGLSSRWAGAGRGPWHMLCSFLSSCPRKHDDTKQQNHDRQTERPGKQRTL